MAKALAWTAVLLAAALGGCSPFGGGNAFKCDVAGDCNAGGGGRCEDNGFCSYLDPSCTESGQRYGDNAGGNSGRCVGDEPTPDTGGGEDMQPERFCYGAANGLVRPCFPAAPLGDSALPVAINTDVGSPQCSSVVTEAPNVCVMAGERIRVENTVIVTGSRPLVLVATGTIEISGTLDAASHRSLTVPYSHVQTGAGSNPGGGCAMGNAPGTSGGGAGGTMVGIGGTGGNGGGTPPGAAQDVTRLRGGCPGQNGNNGVPGDGGRGGGAVYLIADVDIQISGAINASGEGGHPGVNNDAGGGGGGSGGMIVLDTPSITNNGVVFANGGSGGEGSGDNTIGNPGNEANSAAPAAAPLSGSNGGGGGAGGAGGTGGGGANGGLGQAAAGFGGGGGGGGVGVIKLFRTMTLPGDHSPPRTP